MEKIILKANKYCGACGGSGRVYDWVPVPFGVGNCQMPTDCDCLYEDVDDSTIKKIRLSTAQKKLS